MSNETNWLKDLPPFQPDEDLQRAERVQKRVLQKLDEPVESEEIAMKPKMTFRRIRPLIFAAAAVAVGAVSLITANAATGGELFSKLSIYLNGEKQDYPGAPAGRRGLPAGWCVPAPVRRSQGR